MLWNRPENRKFAGKLLIVGGNAQGFSAPATAFSEALKAGVGVARIILPNSLQRTVSKLFPETEFVPSTPSGSLALEALGEVLPAALWADGVLIAGDIGKNSETTILLDRIFEKFSGAVTISGDAINYAILQASSVSIRPHTTIVCTFKELQKIVAESKLPIALTSDMDLVRFVEALHEISNAWQAYVVVTYEQTAFVAVHGKISSTPTSLQGTQIAARAAVWLLQNPSKPYEALTTSLVAD